MIDFACLLDFYYWISFGLNAGPITVDAPLQVQYWKKDRFRNPDTIYCRLYSQPAVKRPKPSKFER